MSIQDDFVEGTCKMGTAECCRYLGRGPKSWVCLKLTPTAAYIDQRVAAGTFRATGDNCEGVP